MYTFFCYIFSKKQNERLYSMATLLDIDKIKVEDIRTRISIDR